MSEKRICVVTLSGRDPLLVLGGFRDNQLHIVKVEKLPKSTARLTKTLPDRLNNFRRKGFSVIIDEVLPQFGKHGIPARLSDMDVNGRPVLVNAFERYFYLMNMRALVFPAGTSGQFEISPSLVEEQRNDKGAVSYRIDWDELKPETTALLLAIYAATSTSLYEPGYLSNLFNGIGSADKSRPNAGARMFDAVTRGFDHQQQSNGGRNG
ncbi:hypothetical protein [Thaumasiovibrio sp. DFM-14]|uniref:hypothetical protein n=1 Tax=Thaumasiovibrio sp. DFM-14 TaxID=3384792 RepID=UPI0039A13DB6